MKFKIIKILPLILSAAALCGTASFSVACGAINTPEPAPEPKPEHTHSYVWVDNGDGTHKRHCAESGCPEPDTDCGEHDFLNGDCVCGKTKPAHTHNYKWVDNGDGTHKRHCAESGCPEPDTDCGEHDFFNGDCVCGKTKPVLPTEGLEYKLNLDKESYEVWSIGTATDTEIVIASEYNGKPVTSIYDRAFENNASIVSVTVPDSVSHIGNFAFASCTSLKSVAVGCGTIAVDNGIFDNCPIETATVPAVICKHVNNPRLKTVEITSGEVIEESAFKGCVALTDVTIPESVKTVGEKAFYNCSALAGINIPASVTQIGKYAFYGCNSLAIITVDADNAEYASCGGILYNKAKTQFVHIPKAICGTVTVPDSVTDIGDNFSGCGLLAGIVIPGGVTFIYFGAFYNCTSLTDITVPGSVTEIYEDAFADCKKLERINFKGAKAQWTALPKGYNYNINTGDYTVQCTDGKLDKDGNEIIN